MQLSLETAFRHMCVCFKSVIIFKDRFYYFCMSRRTIKYLPRYFSFTYLLLTYLPNYVMKEKKYVRKFTYIKKYVNDYTQF